jgi:hypothetical protein
VIDGQTAVSARELTLQLDGPSKPAWASPAGRMRALRTPLSVTDTELARTEEEIARA